MDLKEIYLESLGILVDPVEGGMLLCGWGTLNYKILYLESLGILVNPVEGGMLLCGWDTLNGRCYG